MNCPQCHQPVGQDQFHESNVWLPVHDANGLPIAMERDIYVACSHDGIYALKQNHLRTITASKHVTDEKELRRIEKLIPACRLDRRIAC